MGDKNIRWYQRGRMGWENGDRKRSFSSWVWDLSIKDLSWGKQKTGGDFHILSLNYKSQTHWHHDGEDWKINKCWKKAGKERRGWAWQEGSGRKKRCFSSLVWDLCIYIPCWEK